MKLFSLKLLAAALLISFPLLPACSSSQDASSDFINWRSHSEGLQIAGSQDKKTFLYFRADW